MKIYRALLFLSSCIALAACQESRASRGNSMPELNVLTLKTQAVTIPRDYVCEIDGIEYVEIHARVQGYLEDIYVDEGQSVKKGQLLFRISSHAYSEMVSKAEAALQRAIAEAKAKSLEVDRVRLMVEKNVISPTELEVALAEKDAAESGVNEAQAVRENARINLNYTSIRAPFDGVLDRMPFKKGSLISSGNLLTSISNIREVFAYFQVSETEYLQLLGKEIRGNNFGTEHQKVSLQLADGSAYPHEGRIETIAGDFDKSTGSISIRARFPNPDYILKHGSSGKVLLRKILSDAILVPQQATFSIQDKSYVYVVDQNNIVRVKNFTSLARHKKYFVVQGLQKGERVVIDGLQQIRDGVPIKPKPFTRDSLGITRS